MSLPRLWTCRDLRLIFNCTIALTRPSKITSSSPTLTSSSLTKINYFGWWKHWSFRGRIKASIIFLCFCVTDQKWANIELHCPTRRTPSRASCQSWNVYIPWEELLSCWIIQISITISNFNGESPGIALAWMSTYRRQKNNALKANTGNVRTSIYSNYDNCGTEVNRWLE